MEQEEKSHHIKHLIREGKTNAQARKVKKYNEKSDESASIDLAPMVDIAFLLLTFFMLTTSFSKPNVLEMGLPEDETKQGVSKAITPDNVLTLRVGKTGRTYLNVGLGAPQYIPFNDLKAKVKSYVAANPAIITVIKVDKDATYVNMVDVVDELWGAGIKKFAMAGMTAKEQEEIETAEKK